MAATNFDGIRFASMGDVHQGQAPASVVWANDYFNCCNDLNVPTEAYLDVLLHGQADLQMVGPFPVGDAATELVHSCVQSPSGHEPLTNFGSAWKATLSLVLSSF
jgi:hypothetical protein